MTTRLHQSKAEEPRMAQISRMTQIRRRHGSRGKDMEVEDRKDKVRVVHLSSHRLRLHPCHL